ncbi:MAG: squalene/phytoene synthase family protein [Ferruginibacter sp.]|nr:squalene/phytoene synthase family protein [Rhodoferax sp.]
MRNPAAVPAPTDLTRAAQKVMDTHARSFSSAAVFFSAGTRDDAALLYAFARAADDLCDEEDLGPLAERMQSFARLGAFAEQPGDDTATGNDAMASAAGRVLRRHGVHPQVLAHFLQGLQDDAGPRQLQTTDELLQFAFAVAGTVGQMMRPVLGAPLEVERYAVALGVAMQLTNVARDVEEDALRGRCYLPAQWDPQWRLEAGLATAVQRTKAFAMVRRVLALADDFYAFAAQGLATIPSRNRRAIRIAIALYQGIGHKILKGGPALYWAGRVHLTRTERASRIVQTVLFNGCSGPGNPRSAVAADFLQVQMKLQLLRPASRAPLQFAA